MNRLLYLIKTIRPKPMLSKLTPNRIQKVCHHDEGPPQPFDNMPFSILNRYFATVVFSFFFGLGMWAPYVIVWYSMAKRTL